MTYREKKRLTYREHVEGENSKMKLEVLILFALTCLCTCDVWYDVNITRQLQHFTTQRFPNHDHQEEHLKARKYIKDYFNYHGLIVKTQEFNTSVNVRVTDLTPEDEFVLGENIMGIAPAVSNKPGSVIVVAADYDTNGIDNPMLNNGAGVSVLLETVRLFMHNVRWSGAFSQNFTTVFVALDLNTREHLRSGGKPGGWYFVHEWLWNYLNQSDINFGGAYIIDSVMNLNLGVNTQSLSEDFREMFPETFEHVDADERRGNFLSMVTINMEKSLMLKDQYIGSYNKDRIKRPYRIEDMTLPKSLSMSRLLASLTRQDTIHFWAYEHHNVSLPLPAALITDTERLRNIPLIDNCTDLCQLTPERNEFLTTTTLALTRTLLSRQAHSLPSSSALATAFPALIIAMVLMHFTNNA